MLSVAYIRIAWPYIICKTCFAKNQAKYQSWGLNPVISVQPVVDEAGNLRPLPKYNKLIIAIVIAAGLVAFLIAIAIGAAIQQTS